MASPRRGAAEGGDLATLKGEAVSAGVLGEAGAAVGTKKLLFLMIDNLVNK